MNTLSIFTGAMLVLLKELLKLLALELLILFWVTDFNVQFIISALNEIINNRAAVKVFIVYLRSFYYKIKGK